MPQLILHPATYAQLIESLLAQARDNPGSHDPDGFKIILGEVANIWPASVLASFSPADEQETA